MSGEGESHGQTGESYTCYHLIELIVQLHPPETTWEERDGEEQRIFPQATQKTARGPSQSLKVVSVFFFLGRNMNYHIHLNVLLWHMTFISSQSASCPPHKPIKHQPLVGDWLEQCLLWFGVIGSTFLLLCVISEHRLPTEMRFFDGRLGRPASGSWGKIRWMG